MMVAERTRIAVLTLHLGVPEQPPEDDGHEDADCQRPDHLTAGLFLGRDLDSLDHHRHLSVGGEGQRTLNDLGDGRAPRRFQEPSDLDVA
jgi:hypothetical protein